MMSFDRVLPKPPALYDESARKMLSRQTTNLLEHKIMNNQSSKFALTSHTDGGPVRRPTSNNIIDPAVGSAALMQMHLSSINREKCAQNDLSPCLMANKQMAMIVSGEMAARDRSSSSSPSQSEPPKDPAVQFCLCQPDPKIPRPRNAFILYRQHFQASVVAQNPGLANPEISKIIGEQWRALPSETKKEWKALAEEEKARHQQQYPDYRYQPRRLGRDGTTRVTTPTGINHNPTGATACNRCGGRLMNPPSTPGPDTPFPMSATSTSRPSISDSTSPGLNQNGCMSREVAIRVASPMKLNGEIDGKTRQWDVEGSGQSPLDIKRRRLTLNGIRNGRTESPDTETFAASPQRAYVSRSYQMLPPVRPLRNGEDGRFHDPSLTLPPLQTNMPTLLHNQRNVEATVMTIPFINKIKLLAKISPPLATRSKPIDAWSRGAVIAVDGHDLSLVNDMLKYLGRLLTKEGRYAVRVFEGPEINGRQACSKVGEAGRDATVDYLNIISAWHRISDEIVQFISQPAKAATPIASEDGSSPEVSPKTISPRTLGSRAISGRNPVPIALVPRYQLTTADLYACAIPINDAYAPLDHWQWMASLWRACVGPDVTVYVRECEKEEVDRYGGGNPVEVRLQDARTLVVRRAIGSPREIDEKALKRVGFEVEDFLTR